MSRNSDSFFRNNNVGYVYFNSPESNTSQMNDSEDFLPFNSSFTPPRNSSPNYRYGRQNRLNRSYNRNQNYRRDSGYSNLCYSPNSSFNRSFSSPHKNSRGGHKFKKPTYNKNDIGKYYDPSMTDNPWKELEIKLEKMKNINSEETETETENSQLETTAEGDISDHSEENANSEEDN